MNVGSWLGKAKSSRLAPLDAELIMLTVLGKTERSELVLCAERELTDEELNMAEMMTEMRLRHVPMAYLRGFKEFYGRPFKVTMETLIPRSETEGMVEMALRLPAKRFVDVGTGSGCVAVTLALESSSASSAESLAPEVWGLDTSLGALEVAEANAKKLGARVKFLRSDLLEGYLSQFDSPLEGLRETAVVANLPYVDRKWEWTSPEIEYEPAEALFAGDGGLLLIKRLIDKMAKVCYNEGIGTFLVLEADLSQHEEIKKYAASRGLKFREAAGLILSFEA